MSRYTGPRARVSRRLGENIFGTKGETVALERRPYPPGAHGRTRTRGNNQSEYLFQLQEKQKARFSYGLTERQFRNVYKKASRRAGVTGDNMLIALELRLDNVCYRAGFSSTRPQARQFVTHGHILVNGKRVNIPSYQVSQGDVIEVKQKTRDNALVHWNREVIDRVAPAWLDSSEGGMKVTVHSEPIREQIDIPLREQLIVELYSK